MLLEIQSEVHFPSTEEAKEFASQIYAYGFQDARTEGCPDENSDWNPYYMRGFLDGLLDGPDTPLVEF